MVVFYTSIHCVPFFTLIYPQLIPFYVLGPSIQACRNVSRHIVASEEDKELFDALLKPLI